ncbi:MAG: nucleoside hydrolase [Clostridiales bacterium]|nr:nucleoside hydrolase [Clostridiales bacterium]
MYEVQEYRKKRVIIDTDAACEADDPFAVAQALMSKMLDVRFICAEHFVTPGSMEKSREMCRRIVEAMELDVPVYAGQTGPLGEGELPPLSEASIHILEEARRESANPLYILCLGAITNVARAVLEDPDAMRRCTIVWIGGNAHDCTEARREFNACNDCRAANAVLHSGGDIWQIPSNVYGTMHIGFAEMQLRIRPCGRIGRLLFDNLIAYYGRPEAAWSAGESWSLGDSPAVGVALEPNCGISVRRKAPTIHADGSQHFEDDTPEIRVYTSINSRFILEDLISKLQILYGS